LDLRVGNSSGLTVVPLAVTNGCIDVSDANLALNLDSIPANGTVPVLQSSCINGSFSGVAVSVATGECAHAPVPTANGDLLSTLVQGCGSRFLSLIVGCTLAAVVLLVVGAIVGLIVMRRYYPWSLPSILRPTPRAIAGASSDGNEQLRQPLLSENPLLQVQTVTESNVMRTLMTRAEDTAGTGGG
jgi:hypothetical protein